MKLDNLLENYVRPLFSEKRSRSNWHWKNNHMGTTNFCKVCLVPFHVHSGIYGCPVCIAVAKPTSFAFVKSKKVVPSPPKKRSKQKKVILFDPRTGTALFDDEDDDD